jgi:EAL domain-containing protein (putative c-di-GMP-specific phosphodiesterase class I)
MAPPDWERTTGVQRARVAERAGDLRPLPVESLERAVDELLDARRAPDLVYQPVVDLARGLVVGYEALSRFRGPPEKTTPDRWFAAAHSIGRSVELEALVIERALDTRDRLPSNCFLAINVAPDALLAAPVHKLLQAGPLSRIVFELTEHSAVNDYDLLARAISEVRSRGAFVAVDDAGAGYASLQHVLMLRPDFVKLDRSLIAGLHLDEAKAALIEMFGGFTSRIDAWLLAEGIEEQEELVRLTQLGVPLGQGYLLGRPAPTMMGLDPVMTAVMRGRGREGERERALGALAEPYPCLPSTKSDAQLLDVLAESPHLTLLPLLDESTRPSSIAVRFGSHDLVRRSALTALYSCSLRDALKRALTRPTASRFDPLICCDELGHYLGVVRVERLVEALIDTPDSDAWPASTRR